MDTVVTISGHPVAARKSDNLNVPLSLSVHTILILLAGSVGCVGQNKVLIRESSIVLLVNIASNAANRTLLLLE